MSKKIVGMMMVVAVMLVVAGEALGDPIVVQRSRVDSIRGATQNTTDFPVGYFVDEHFDGISGVSGAGGSRRCHVPVIQFTLPEELQVLGEGEVIQSVTINYEIWRIRHNSGTDFNAHVYLLDTDDPSVTGTDFYHQGPQDTDPDVIYIGETELERSGTADRDPDPPIAVSHTLTGDALLWFQDLYDGAEATQTNVFFRFNRSSATTGSFDYDRFYIEVGTEDLFLEIVTGTPVPMMLVTRDGVEIEDGGTDVWTGVDIDTPVALEYVVTNSLVAQGDLELDNSPDAVVFEENGQTSYNGFTITQNIPGNTTIEPGDSESFTVAFETSEAGTYSATISIDNNDPGKDPYEFTIEATVEELPEISRNLIVYEGFNYEPSGTSRGESSLLNQQPTDPGGIDVDAIGLVGTYGGGGDADNDFFMKSGSLSFGDLLTSGNHVRSDTNSGDQRANRALSAEATESIASADEIWFSFLAERILNNFSNGREGIAIANGVLSDPRFDLANASGLHGFGIAATDGGDGWRAWGWDGSDGVESSGSFSVSVNQGEVNLLIGHIQFDSGTDGKDVFTFYHYDRDFVEGSITADMENLVEVDTIEVDVDQSELDRLNVTRQVNTAFDEIRIGTTLDSVLGLVEPPAGTLIILM